MLHFAAQSQQYADNGRAPCYLCFGAESVLRWHQPPMDLLETQ